MNRGIPQNFLRRFRDAIVAGGDGGVESNGGGDEGEGDGCPPQADVVERHDFLARRRHFALADARKVGRVFHNVGRTRAHTLHV